MSEHQPASIKLAWRPGWRYGVVACVGIALDIGVQRVRHLLGWPPGTTTWLNWVAFTLPFLLVIIAGYRAGRARGNMKMGAWAGAFAGALPTTVLGLAVAVTTIVVPSRKLTPSENLKTALIILAMGPILGAICGYFLAAFPAWVGRLVFRRHDPHYIAKRVARLRLPPAERRKRWIKNDLLPAVAGVGLAGLVVAILLLPDFIATWIRASLPGWRITLSIATVALSLALFVVFRKHLYIRIGTNWLALFMLALGLLLGFASPDTSWILLFTRLVVPSLSAWLIITNGVDATMAPALRAIAQLVGEDQPLPPVYFHAGGTRLTYYPSRRILALHLLFAGTLGLLFLAILAVPAVPLFIQWCVALFGVMALIFGAVPDVIRLLVRWPVLVVTDEGIIDQGSVGLYGFGLIPWNQVEGVFYTRARLRQGRFSEVHIRAAHEDSLIAAQPFYKRPLLKLMTRYRFTIPISAIVLSPPPAQIVEQITAYVKRYAPSDYANAVTEEDAPAEKPHTEVEDD